MGTTLKMRDLERATGVGREAIRFYIREGLLPEPERPRRNVAHYSDDHVVRIRAIKRLQEDERLQLSEIRAVLVDGDAGAIAEGRGPELSRIMGDLLGARTAHDRSLADVAADGIEESEILALAELGVVTLRDGDRLDDLDARLCLLWGRAASLGLTAERGFDASILRTMQTHMEAIAREQIDRFMWQVGVEGAGEDAARIGAEGLLLSRDVLAIMQLRSVLAELRARTPDGDRERPHQPDERHPGERRRDGSRR